VPDRDQNRSRVFTAALTLAVFAAPFLALFYGPSAALAVMAAALVAVTFLLRGAASSTSLAARRWLRLALIVDLVLALACLVAAIWLVFWG
jgi:hypothetical protein